MRTSAKPSPAFAEAIINIRHALDIKICQSFAVATDHMDSTGLSSAAYPGNHATVNQCFWVSR